MAHTIKEQGACGSEAFSTERGAVLVQVWNQVSPLVPEEPVDVFITGSIEDGEALLPGMGIIDTSGFLPEIAFSTVAVRAFKDAGSGGLM